MRIVGIDVSKHKVDAAIMSASAHMSFENHEQDRQELLAWLDRHEVGKAVMEATGGYERSWAKMLQGAGIEVRIVDPKRVRYYAQAAGQQAKTDRLDAEMIALFGEAFADATGRPHDAQSEAMDQLVSGRRRLKLLGQQLENWQEHDTPPEIQQIYQELGDLLDNRLKDLDEAIGQRIETDERLARRAEIIESMPGLGPGSAAGLIAWLPELGLVDNKAIAALVGVAPYAEQSGSRDGPRSIRGGRGKLRNLLYLPVVGAATRSNPVLKAHYEQLIARGKEPKVALIACMRKLIVILNTMIARGETWQPEKHRQP